MNKKFLIVIIVALLLAGFAAYIIIAKLFTPIYTQDSWKTMIPATCKQYYDGCNMCSHGASPFDGCTMRGCSKYTKPECLDGITDRNYLDNIMFKN